MKKPFRCKLCPDSFRRSVELAQHYRHMHRRHKGAALKAARGNNNHAATQEPTDADALSHLHDHTILAFGSIKNEIRHHAESAGIPEALLAERVARLLLAQTSGKAFRVEQHLSSVWREAAARA